MTVLGPFQSTSCFPPSSPSSLRSSPSLPQFPSTSEHTDWKASPTLPCAPQASLPLLWTSQAEGGSLPKVQLRLHPQKSSSQAKLKDDRTQLTDFKPSFPPSPGAAVRLRMEACLPWPRPRAGAPEKEGFVQSRPRALAHNERKPSNEKHCYWALCPREKAELKGVRRCQAGGQRGSCKHWRFMPHFTPGSAPNPP